MRIDDVSPDFNFTTITLGRDFQSVSGKALCVACSADGMRVYLGGHSGVWRSDNGGVTWRHPEHPQPSPGRTSVPGALPVTTIYDLTVSRLNPDVILASAGRDARVPPASGLYRSVNGARHWSLVHQFAPPPGTGRVFASQISFAPDDPQRVYAAGGSAVAISLNGGVTWTESKPAMPPSERIWHVVAGPQEGAIRRVYAVGSRVWSSLDGGLTWVADPISKPLGPPADGLGTSTRALSIHPSNPRVIYLMSERVPWRAAFPATAGAAVWSQLPLLPTNFGGVTASGTDYIVAHITPSGLLHLFASDRQTSHLAFGEPVDSTGWTRIDGNNVHLDPHGIALTRDFQTPGIDLPPRGRVFVVNDGGLNWSTDGARTWVQGRDLTSLGLVNAAVCSRPGKAPAICIGMGDNSGFFSGDGGVTWKTQDYIGGDNDCCFADPRQPSALIVFAPRDEPDKIYQYVAPAGEAPDGAAGTNQRKRIPGPPPIPPSGNASWNCVSNFYNAGYRPLVLTARDEPPPADTDLVTIRFTPNRAFLMRTTKLSQVTTPEDWLTTVTADGPGVKVFQQGPELPDARIGVVQASGGHRSPVFYVGDPEDRRRLWKWTAGMAAWQQLVPGPLVNGVPTPRSARRFYVDPYRSNLIYVIDTDRVLRSDDGGAAWTADTRLQNAVSENGAFPFDAPFDGNPGQALIRDMAFDPDHAGYRFAAAPSGVFHTLDGVRWSHLLLSSASAMRPNNLVYDSVSDRCNRALYVATSNRGLLRLRPLPPDWDFKIGALVNTSGRVTFLRVHDVGTMYGPPHDQIDAEVIFWLDSEPEKAFGLLLRADGDEFVNCGMLNLLRLAYRTRKPVGIDYTRHSCRNGKVLRMWLS